MENAKYLLTGLFLFLNLCLFSQNIENDCGTIDLSDSSATLLPYYDNPEFLREFESSFEDSVQALGVENYSRNSSNHSIFKIPIVFWIYADGVNDTGFEIDLPDQADYEAVVNLSNELFQQNSLPMQFYIKCIREVNVNNVLNINTRLDAITRALINRDLSAINVHVLAWTEAQVANFYNSYSDAIFLRRVTLTNPERHPTIPHELGHFFGLAHTHRGWNDGNNVTENWDANPWWSCMTQEPVSRNVRFRFCPPFRKKNCSITGDFICDTPAAPHPNTGGGGIFVEGADGIPTYIGHLPPQNLRDEFGEIHIPDVTNIMSQANQRFRQTFSNGQESVILFNLLQRINPLTISWLPQFSNAIGLPDEFEEDNTIMTASQLLSGETQNHTFHTQGLGCEQDEVDWYVLENEDLLSDRQVVISFDDVNNNPVDNADIRVVRANPDGTVISDEVFDINLIGSSTIIDLRCNLFGTFRDVRLALPRNDNSNDREYEIEFINAADDIFINANQQACIGGELILENLPNGATVDWIPIGGLQISDFGTNSRTILNTSSSGIGMGIVTVINLGDCSIRIEHNFEVPTISLGEVGPISSLATGADCDPSFQFSVSEVQGATDYLWECNGPIEFQGCSEQDNTAYAHTLGLSPGQLIEIDVRVTVVNDCGNSKSNFRKVVYAAPFDCDMQITNDSPRSVEVSPNPINNQFQLAIVETDPSSGISTYQILLTNPYGETDVLKNGYQSNEFINAQNLMNGLNYVHVLVGEHLITRQIVIQH